jgi:AcrR family transcriptional regulator
MTLLWGLQEKPRRGPKPKLTVAQITAAAIDLADAEGLEAVSMRRIAEKLGGVTAMSLYTYVPGKAELLDLMFDAVYAELHDPIAPGPWRTRLETAARRTRDVYLRHPWLVQVAVARPVLGPNVMAKYELDLSTIDGLGLTEIDMELTLSAIGDFVHGAARGAVTAAQAEKHTGMSDLQWWEATEPLLTKVWNADSYPVASRVGAVTGPELGAGDPQRSFDFGLALLLDGVEALIARRAKGS